MIEFDVDMSYLLECDELDKVVLNDENGDHEPMEFVPRDAATVSVVTCHKKWRGGYGFCSECGHNITGEWAKYCPNCGRKVAE